MYRGPGGSRPQVVVVEDRETEESPNRSRSPRQRKAAYRPHGKVTKHPSPRADPVIAMEEKRSSGGPSGLGEKEASQARTNSWPKTRTCPTCEKKCRSTQALSKHQREVHMGHRFKYKYCPKKYKTVSSRKNHKD